MLPDRKRWGFKFSFITGPRVFYELCLCCGASTGRRGTGAQREVLVSMGSGKVSLNKVQLASPSRSLLPQESQITMCGNPACGLVCRSIVSAVTAG